MQPEQIYLAFDGNMTRANYPPCPFPLPWASNYQCVMLIGLLYRQALDLEEIIKVSGHKLNDHAIQQFRVEIGRTYFDIMNFKAAIEN